VLAQVGGVLVEAAGLSPDAVFDQQLLRAVGPGEAADGVAGQAQPRWRSPEVAALREQQAVHVRVPGPGPVWRPARPAAAQAPARGPSRPARPGL
jgi:hypothetical protein